MSKSNPWQFIHDALDSVDKYYGIKIRDSIKYNAANEMINNLAEYGRSYLPEQVYAKCIDGKIRKGFLTDRLVIEMLAIRSKCPSKQMNEHLWETVLAKYGDPIYTYCFDSSTFHPEIMVSVGLYLMKHKCSRNIYNIILGNARLKEIKVEQAKLFDFYVKKEKSIEAKKDIFRQQFDESINVDSKYFAFDYATKIILEKGPKQRVLSKEELNSLKIISNEQDIAYCDLVYRVSIGMDTSEALRLGKEESEKYGFKSELSNQKADSQSGSYTLEGNNYNLMMYINYLASTEELEGIKIEE